MKVHNGISPFHTHPGTGIPELSGSRTQIVDFIAGLQFIDISTLMIRRELS